MTNPELDKAMEAIYASLRNDNEGLDPLILELKKILHAQGLKSVEVDLAKIPFPNRQGRKTMQSYFRRRGVAVTFPETKATETDAA